MKPQDFKALKKIIDSNPDWVREFNEYKPTKGGGGRRSVIMTPSLKANMPYKCPVCNGRGTMPNGFYMGTQGQWSTTNASPEQCRSCNGKGIIWS